MTRAAALLLLGLLGLSSCVFVAGAAVGAGAVYALSEDSVETYFEAPREAVHAAARDLLDAVETEELGAKESRLEGEADGVRYGIGMSAVTPGTTRVVVQARKWKTLAPDLDAARSLVDRLALQLP